MIPVVSTAPEITRPWRNAALWALPVALWLVAQFGAAGALIETANDWQQKASSWRSTIDLWRSEGRDDIADPQQQTLDHLNHDDGLRLLELVAVCGAAGFAALLYRRKVPPHRRGGWRAVGLAVGLIAVLGLGFALLLLAAMGGGLKG
jgi:hypothetical protein